MIEMPKVDIGRHLIIQRTVNHEDTALNYGSGKLEKLLATPRLIALMIEASVKLIDDHLPEGFITVGKMAKIVHHEPTILGETVSIKVTIKEYDGNRILLDMEAYDEIGTIGQGSHERIIVNKKSLLNKADKRAGKLENMDF